MTMRTSRSASRFSRGLRSSTMRSAALPASTEPVDVAVTTPDFFALNVKLAYEFPILRTLTLQLNAGVQNLFDSYQSDFDQGWERDSGYVYGPSLPRSWFVGEKIRF